LRAWRFHRRIHDPIDASGSRVYGGRWNRPGVPVVYASVTYAGGLLELIANASSPRHPPRDHLASLLEVPDDSIATLERPLPPGWDDPHDYQTARNLAEPWLTAGSRLCLSVPSVPGSPIELNIVINTGHTRFGEVVVLEQIGPVWDPRLWGLVEHLGGIY
jgi:RES domain-containing protein